MVHSDSSSEPRGTRRSNRSRWLLRLAPAAVFSLALVALALPLACTTTVVPPPEPEQPVLAFVLDYGRTSALVLPTADGMAEYVYGDWDYYALSNRGIGDAIAAMCWPTPAGMGRGTFDGPATLDNLLHQIRETVDRVHPVPIQRSAAERLESRLYHLYQQGRPQAVEHAGYGLTFVPHPRDYHYFHNSNHVTADWLAELGCHVQGLAFYSRWRIAERGGASPAGSSGR
jgi:hypothetical protein